MKKNVFLLAAIFTASALTGCGSDPENIALEAMPRSSRPTARLSSGTTATQNMQNGSLRLTRRISLP